MLDTSTQSQLHLRIPEEAKSQSAKKLTTYFKDPHIEDGEPNSSYKNTEKQDLARQRWKILCLVKTSSAATDEECRQERIKDRVDEWMSGFMQRLRLETAKERDIQDNCEAEDNSFRDSGLDLDPGFDLADSSSLTKSLSSTRSEMRKSRTRERRKHEHEQRKRIRQREKEEKERERKLVLEGKLEPSQSQLKDPLLKVHHNLLSVHRRAGSTTRSVSPAGRSISANSNRGGSTKKSPRPKRRAKSKSSVKLKWKTTLDGVKVQKVYTNGHDNKSQPPEEDSMETVIASLVYDEDKDRLVDAAEATTDTAEDQLKSTTAQHSGNPVFLAFDQAKNVDDLFRIAEIWVNPTSYDPS